MLRFGPFQVPPYAAPRSFYLCVIVPTFGECQDVLIPTHAASILPLRVRPSRSSEVPQLTHTRDDLFPNILPADSLLFLSPAEVAPPTFDRLGQNGFDNSPPSLALLPP